MSAQISQRLGFPFIISGQAQKDVTHNEALALLDAAVAASAESIGFNTPPVGPLIGQCWIVGIAPTGTWAGFAGALALWTDGGWRFVMPVQGMRVWLKDQGLWADRGASSWSVGQEVAARLSIGGVQVVGARQAAVAAPSGGTVVDVEARSALMALIGRLVAHGLIEP